MKKTVRLHIKINIVVQTATSHTSGLADFTRTTLCYAQNQNSDDAWVAEANGPRFNFLFQLNYISIVFETFLEVLQLLAFLFLDGQGNLAAAIKEFAHLLKLRDATAARCHSWGANSNTSRRQS